MNTDTNLLFGVLALQLDFIDMRQFVEACSTWAASKEGTLGDVMVARGWLSDQEREEVERLLQRRLLRNDNDARRAPGASTWPEVRDALRSVDDQDVHDTLTGTPPVSNAVQLVDTVDLAFEERSCHTLSRVQAVGGQSRVWRARDKRLNREVALKELRPDKPRTRLAEKRFINEAQITGQLDHPNIVTVYELTRAEDSRPFYTMPMLGSTTLNAAIDNFHRCQRGGKEKRLERRKLLDAFVNICHAVAFAHSKRIIHRDLKPSNVMLGSFGEVIVLDWGLAKHLDQDEASEDQEQLPEAEDKGDEIRTETGQALGTPAYMAPEQAEGRRRDIGIWTDVYGLGSILFKTLTGSPPHLGRNTHEMLQRAATKPTPQPRAIDPKIPVALAAICTRAMAEQRAGRYASAAELGEDVRRWLADEPVSAYREPWHERGARWLRRHRAWTRSAVAILLTIAIVSSIALPLINNARRREQTAKAEALSRFRESLHTVESMLTGVSEVLRYYPHTQALRTRLLQEAAADYERFADIESNDPKIRVEEGRVYVLLGDVHRRLEKAEEARAAYRHAWQIFEKLARRRNGALDVRLQTAVCQGKLGDVCSDEGKYEESKQAYIAALDKLQQLEQTAETQFAGTRIRLAYAQLEELYGSREKAEQLLRESESELSELVLRQAKSSEPRHRETLALAQSLLGRVLVAAGRNADAVEPLGDAVNSYQDLVTQFGDQPRYQEGLAFSNINLANAYHTLGSVDDEIVALQNAIDDYEDLLQAMPDIPVYRENLAVALASLGRVFHVCGLNGEANKRLDAAVGIFQDLVGSPWSQPRYWEELALAATIQAQIMTELDMDDDAGQNLQSALQVFLDRLIPAEPGVSRYQRDAAVSQRHIARLLFKRGELDSAQERFDGAIDAFRAVLQQDPDDLYARDGLARTLEHLGDLSQHLDQEQSRGLFEQAHQEREKLPDDPEYLYLRGRLLLKTAESQGAEHDDALRDAVTLANGLVDVAPDNGSYLTLLGQAELQSEAYAQSIATLSKVDQTLGKARPDHHFLLAMAYLKRNKPGDRELARTSFKRGIELLEENAPGRMEALRLRRQVEQLLQ